MCLYIVSVDPKTQRMTALEFRYLASEYAVNESCRLITGCLKPTALNKLYTFPGISNDGFS